MTSGRRVVVTGLGTINPLGDDVETTWKKAVEGRSGIGPITRFDTEDFAVDIAGEVKNYEPGDHFDRRSLRRLDRNVQYALIAGREAVVDAGLTETTKSSSTRYGVVFGSAMGGIESLSEQFERLAERGPGRVSPYFLPEVLVDSASGRLAMEFGWQGMNAALVSACASGTSAVGEAAETIRRGDADVMLAGGSEAVITPLILAGFNVMKALAGGDDDPASACKPFDARREGFVMAEGAAALILESFDHAADRDAAIYGEWLGYGSTNDAYDMAAPSPEGQGAAAAMKMAIEKANIDPAEVDYINAHGTGTPMNDVTETAAIRQTFKARAGDLAVSSTKSMTGHLFGSAGALEALFCLCALKEGIIPPTINYKVPDPECDLDIVPNEAREQSVRIAMSNSFGLGGHNSSILFARSP